MVQQQDEVLCVVQYLGIETVIIQALVLHRPQPPAINNEVMHEHVVIVCGRQASSKRR